MVLLAGLVLLQRLATLVITQQAVVIALTSLDGIRYGRRTDDQAVLLNAAQVLQFLQLSLELVFIFLGHLWAESEHHCLSIYQHDRSNPRPRAKGEHRGGFHLPM